MVQASQGLYELKNPCRKKFSNPRLNLPSQKRPYQKSGDVSQHQDSAKKIEGSLEMLITEGAVYINVECSNYKECFRAQGWLP